VEAYGGALEVDALHEAAMDMEVHIDPTAKTLDKRDRAWVEGGPLETACDRLVDVILTDGGAHDRMDLGREVLGPRHPVAQGDRHRDAPLAGKDPGNHLLHEMRGGLGPAPPRTGRTQTPPLATERDQQLRLAPVTAEREEDAR